MRASLLALSLSLMLPCLAAAQHPSEGGGGGGAPGPDFSERILRIQVEADYAGMHRTADFLVENANQSNFVTGGDKSFPVETKAGKGVEYKKWGFIANVLPVEDPNATGKVNLQIQVEISGPVAGKEGVDMETWQLQTTVTVVKGKPKTVSRGAGKLVVTVLDDSDK